MWGDNSVVIHITPYRFYAYGNWHIYIDHSSIKCYNNKLGLPFDLW